MAQSTLQFPFVVVLEETYFEGPEEDPELETSVEVVLCRSRAEAERKVTHQYGRQGELEGYGWSVYKVRPDGTTYQVPCVWSDARRGLVLDL